MKKLSLGRRMVLGAQADARAARISAGAAAGGAGVEYGRGRCDTHRTWHTLIMVQH